MSSNVADCTALMEAVGAGNTRSIRRLLDGGAEVNFRFRSSVTGKITTPLMVASGRGDEEVVRVLLDAGLTWILRILVAPLL